MPTSLLASLSQKRDLLFRVCRSAPAVSIHSTVPQIVLWLPPSSFQTYQPISNYVFSAMLSLTPTPTSTSIKLTLPASITCQLFPQFNCLHYTYPHLCFILFAYYLSSAFQYEFLENEGTVFLVHVFHLHIQECTY